MIKRIYKIVMMVAVAALCACSTPKEITYFQDTDTGGRYAIAHDLDIRMRCNDKVSIVVHSRDAQLAQMFNLPVQSQRVGNVTGGNQGNQMSVYTVDNRGYIDFPGIGELNVLNKNREEVAAMIKSEITTRNLLKDPVVTVEFDNMFINVLGEVNKPGRYALTKDRVSVLDALGMAGDLTIQGQRRNVKVLRVENGARTVYNLDMTMLTEVVASPAYYLQQDDVVVVEPNDYKKRQTTVNGNNSRSASLYVSLGSLLMSVAALLVNILK